MTYRIHNMHGPTVFEYDRLEKALTKLYSLRLSNGGVYSVRDSRDKKYASLDTFATYEPLCFEENERKRQSSASVDSD